MDLTGIQIGVFAADSDPVGTQRPGAIDATGRFQLEAFPGRVFPRVSDGRWLLLSVTLNGVDVTDSGILLESNTDLTGVEIRLTKAFPVVSGNATVSAGSLAKDYSVIAFLRRKGSEFSGGGRYLALARPDQNGSFTLKALPPGDYCFAAVPTVDPLTWTDPAYLDSLRARATNLQLRLGEQRTITLPLLR